MKKRIFALFILVCFCITLMPAFAAYNQAAGKNTVKQDEKAGIKFTLLKLEYDDYIGKEVYIRGRILPWSQDKYVVYKGPDVFLVENRIAAFKPRANDEVLMKVKVLRKDYVDYLQVVEGAIITPVAATVMKKGAVVITESYPFHVLTLVVSPNEKYEITGDLQYKMKDYVGNQVIAEGKIRDTSYNVFDKSLDVVKFGVIK